jgi:hypothetical protein
MNGKKRSTKTFPAFRDRQLQDRPSEQWEDIPGLDGYFMVSNFGRIKRNERELLTRYGVIRKIPEKIISPRVAKTYNKHMRDYKYQLHAHLRMEGRKYHLPIRRLVYHCFVKPIPLDDLSICIVSKRGNGLDISPANLEIIDRLDRTRRIYAKKRMVSIFRQESNRLKGVAASLAVTRRQVSQYDQKGKRVNTFASISDAARATGINLPGIGHAANEIEPTAGGFFWKFGNEKTFDVKEFLARRLQGYKEKRGAKVTQYDRQGNPVGHYITLQEAGKAINGHWTAISAVIRGIRNSAYGYRWKRGYHKRKIKALK